MNLSNSLSDDGFLSMGGYAAYVWPSYFGAALVLAAVAWHSLRRLRRAERLYADVSARSADAPHEDA